MPKKKTATVVPTTPPTQEDDSKPKPVIVQTGFFEDKPVKDTSGLDAAVLDKTKDDKHPQATWKMRGGVLHVEYPQKPCPCTERWTGASGNVYCTICSPQPKKADDSYYAAKGLWLIQGVPDDGFDRGRFGSSVSEDDTTGKTSAAGDVRHVEAAAVPVEDALAIGRDATSGADWRGDSGIDLDETPQELEPDPTWDDGGEKGLAILRAVGRWKISGKEGK